MEASLIPAQLEARREYTHLVRISLTMHGAGIRVVRYYYNVNHVKRNLSDIITSLDHTEHNNTFSQYVKLSFEPDGIVCAFGHTHFYLACL